MSYSAKYSVTWSVARYLYDSCWASCNDVSQNWNRDP